jgi:hypothetical protein
VSVLYALQRKQYPVQVGKKKFCNRPLTAVGSWTGSIGWENNLENLAMNTFI